MRSLIDKLSKENYLTQNELEYLLDKMTEEDRDYLIEKAYDVRKKYYGDTVFFRGLIEISNICKCDCFYCGIRKSNKKADRYRLSKEEILDSCHRGYFLGYRTFVFQGGEDSYFTDNILEEIIRELKNQYNDIAITLSLGERGAESFKRLYDAGADRYLLRHETVDEELYNKLHPGMSLENRKKCLESLKSIGYQVGSGFLIGLPGLKLTDYAKDLVYLKKLRPHMVGIGPFIPHEDTPLKAEKGGTAYDTITLLAIIRLLLPDVLLPATTALGTIDPKGREKGFKAGANVIMPNLSPMECRKKYALYNGKVFLGKESAEEKIKIENSVLEAGFQPILTKGDNVRWKRK
ncbi:[FeFe] hydrogenase H-cluster radical SAM maturase HydE [Candidatus Cetobacterium colombiensis]|uniref:[FeFe] hydrogenase H-cluster radical SAM maturase HydE n=1 Tax=Candidatus Cetobacterium colombiensis TaxID=3073100 RepID=A0ABU4W683_9FUSO|nr:[FeFe] hydrogenase H-cluster radical SAM maturase HydE [Candidatus Cetobacterium colombiensis]MDX8335041.1 [FeFe] hydrogenase H-cluster radical SAM maturase HydE [Candidatus Cetobacterium colombiensis]